jgi:cobalt-precorrin 5A hydrolase / precorrin-3B C17-methyltransferase
MAVFMYFFMTRLWVGIGYQKGTLAPAIAQTIAQVLMDFQLDLSLVIGLGTIDRKADDPEIWQICQSHGWQLYFFSSAELAIVPVPHPSALPQLDTSSIAEAAALLAAGHSGKLLVTKQICWQAGKALTIAVAQADLIS